MVGWWKAEGFQHSRGGEFAELAECPFLNVLWQLARPLAVPDFFGFLVLKALYHLGKMMLFTVFVNIVFTMCPQAAKS